MTRPMSARRTLHVVDHTPEIGHLSFPRRMREFIARFEALDGDIVDTLAPVRNTSGHHPGDNRLVTKGSMRFEMTHPGRRQQLSIIPYDDDGFRDMRIEIPIGLNRRPTPAQALHRMTQVLDALDAASWIEDGFADTWRRGIGALAVSRGASNVEIEFPNPWMSLAVTDDEHHAFTGIPAAAMRRISAACPHIVILNTVITGDANIPDSLRIQPQVLPYAWDEGGEDALDTMRALAMVHDVSGLAGRG